MDRRTIQTRTLRMQLCEAGQGPLVVLCHGFPELGSTWRHQLRALAAAGYHAVAPDQRGYGLTESPVEVERYTMLHLVGDVVALIEALGEDRAVLVGHDWGAPVVWNTALLRPDRVRGVVGISVPPARRSQVRPTEALRSALGEDYYQLQFQAPGAADAELARDVRTTFLRLLYGASGSVPAEHRWRPAAGGFLSGMALPEDGAVPRWIEASHVDELVATFARTGFTGGLSWYRNLDRNWELLAPFEGLRIQPPALFVIGDADPGYETLSARLPALPEVLAQLAGTLVLPGGGHWLGEEQPDEVNDAILGFLADLDRTA
jgi:pimeloyl-ACP methyl ester carboxylesterase